MKVLFVDQFSDFGGAQLCLRDVILEATRRGWKPWFMAPQNGALFRFCDTAGIPAQPIPLRACTNGSKSARDILQYALDISRTAFRIRQMVRKNGIDLIYVNGPRILPAAICAPCPLVFHAHSFLDKRYSRLIARWCLRRSRGTVIAVSEFVAAASGPETKCGSIRIISNGVADCGYLPRPRLHRTVNIGIVGRISPEKGHLDFVRAARLLASRSQDIRFAIFGAALFSNPAYESTVRDLAAGTPVEFRGWTDDVPAALHEIDILAVPSSGSEASPRIVMEAFSAGTPIVAYPSGGIPELIRNGSMGLVTERAGHKSLALGIETMLRDPGLMARCSVNGRREWEARFRVERFRLEIADLIEKLCDEDRRQSQSAAAIA